MVQANILRTDEITESDKKKMTKVVKKIAKVLAKANLEESHEVIVLKMLFDEYYSNYATRKAQEILWKAAWEELSETIANKLKQCENCEDKLTCPESLASLE